jgi:hypothetical protein
MALVICCFFSVVFWEESNRKWISQTIVGEIECDLFVSIKTSIVINFFGEKVKGSEYFMNALFIWMKQASPEVEKVTIAIQLGGPNWPLCCRNGCHSTHRLWSQMVPRDGSTSWPQSHPREDIVSSWGAHSKMPFSNLSCYLLSGLERLHRLIYWLLRTWQCRVRKKWSILEARLMRLLL